MIIGPAAIIGPTTMKNLRANEISVVRIKPGQKGSYHTAYNIEQVRKAIIDRTTPKRIIDIILKVDGTVDKECKAVVDGNICFNSDGTIDERCNYCIDGIIQLNDKGQID